jgi:hypothetical protein
MYLQHGAAWDRIREVRERWGIEAQTRIPPAYPGGLYTPESFGPPPCEEQSGNEEYDQWHSTYQEWADDLSNLCNAVVPDEARYSKYFGGSGWDLFLSMCVLYDPPETKLVEFADRIRWSYSNVIPRGKHTMNFPPIVWLRNADRAETTMMEFFGGLLEALIEEYVHPQGVASEDAIGQIREERPEIFERMRKGLYDNESHPYIDVKPYHTQEELESAIQLLVARHVARPPEGRPRRDELTAVQCAILHDRYNRRKPDNRREWTWHLEKLAEEFGLGSRVAARDYVKLGRELLKN